MTLEFIGIGVEIVDGEKKVLLIQIHNKSSRYVYTEKIDAKHMTLTYGRLDAPPKSYNPNASWRGKF